MVARAKFDAAVAAARSLPASISDSEKLQLYALYKQSTVGNAPSEAPNKLNAIAFSKWKSWNALGSRSADEAMSSYVALVESLSRPVLQDDPFRKMSTLLAGALEDGALDDNQPVCIHAYKARAMPQTLNAFGCLLISLMPSVAVHRIVGIIPTIT